MKIVLSFVLAFSFFFSHAQDLQSVRISWDTWGVPHIQAENEADLFYAQGWAQMEAHANLICELYGRARGKAAEYWGEDRLQEDLLIHTLGLPELAKTWRTQQDPQLKTIMDSFLAGMNAYAINHQEAIKEENKVVLPFVVDDINQHAMFVIFTRFIGGDNLEMAQEWEDKGSNTYAISRERSASGNAMLVQNPHLPWWKEFTFFESHFQLAGKSMYGVTLVGFPGIAIGFNENLGWSHTDNTLDNADTYELTLDGDGYLLDGVRKEFEKVEKIIKIKKEDGSLSEQEVALARSVHGPVVRMGTQKAMAIRLAGVDRPNAILQWWKMVNSSNLEEFESALQMGQIPFWNVMYADKYGDIFYLFNGLVPKRNEGDWAYWQGVVPGDQSANIWNSFHSYAELPKVKNPKQGWLQNANDPPWTCTIPLTLNPDDFPAYMSPTGMSFRPQRSARMLMEDESITFEELVSYKLSTRVEFADRMLDDLFAAVDTSDSELAKEAKAVLMAWDRSANADSKGMFLFTKWAQKFQPWNDAHYTKVWDPKQPTTTPDGIASSVDAVALLEAAATEVKAQFGKLDGAWGDYYRINYNGKDLPANGANGYLGVFRVAWPGYSDETHAYVGGGDSWVGVLEFGEKVKAKVLLSYGNATQPDSPHNGDQLQLFSEKKLRDAWFYPESLQGHIEKTEFLKVP